jgi:hypothetical protein
MIAATDNLLDVAKTMGTARKKFSLKANEENVLFETTAPQPELGKCRGQITVREGLGKEFLVLVSCFFL